MSFVATVVRKLNPPAIASKWNVLSAASIKNFSSSKGYTTEELERFRKIFRALPSYEESISSKDLIAFCKAIKLNKPPETYQKYVEFTDKILGGRFEMTQITKYLQTLHDPRLLMDEYLETFDRNKDGYVSKDEFEIGMDTLRLHEPTVKHITYENFVKEADTDKDGRISVAECKAWLNKTLP